MRIAMACSNHAVTDARVTYKQAASLAQAGHEVRVFGLEGQFPVDLPGVTVQAVGPFRIGVRARMSMRRRLYGPVLEWKPDIVTGHEPETAALGLRLRRRIGCRVVFDVHELWQESMSLRAPGVVRPLVKAAFAAALRRIGRRVDWVTVVSPWNLDFYRRARGDDRVDIIHNSPPVERFPPCRQSDEGPVVVVHEGALDLGRGMVQMLEALAMARQSADVRMLIVGGIRKPCRPLFQEKVAALGLADVIEAPGWVPYEEVGERLSRAHVGIVGMQPSPNNYLSLSNKIYNYMGCALPAVVPAGSATADLVREADCGIIVDTTRPDEVAQGLVTLARDRPLRERLGGNGRKAILERYGWHRMAERLRHIYGALA